MEPWTSLLEHLRTRALPSGLDLAQPLQVGWYNAHVAPPYRLPDFGRPASLAVLLGNTRALWPRFVEALRREPALADAAHPLEAYVTGAVDRTLAQVGVRHEVRHAHEPPPRRIAIQRLAQVSGLAWLSPAHLSVHPEYGPWLSLRSVAVLDVEGPPGAAPALPRPCEACAQACEPALARALALASAPGLPQREHVQAHWRAWLAVREACPLGRRWRYQEEHLRYGYTGERALLRRLATGG